jgi:23S rRNA (pseudouridine1915-N3)-methyltransferase
MLELELICVGKLKQGFLREGCAEYIKMLTPYAGVTVTELREERLRGPGQADIERVVEAESREISRTLSGRRAVVAAMCVEGQRMDSPGLAAFLRRAAMEFGRAVFIIGGSHGVSRELEAGADMRISMSDMTFPHQLARLMLLEQLYRACNINANGKYHK